MDIKNFFGIDNYYGVFADKEADFERRSDVTIPASISGRNDMALKVTLRMHWANLYKALRLYNGITEAGENIFIGKSGNKYVVEFTNKENNTYIVFSEMTPSADTLLACAVRKSGDLEAIEALPVKNAQSLALIHYLPLLMGDKLFEDKVEAIKDLLKKDFINASEWSEDEMAFYELNVGYLKYKADKTVLYKEFGSDFKKITNPMYEKIKKEEFTAIVGKPNILKVRETKKKKTDAKDKLEYVFDSDGYLVAKPENWLDPTKERTFEELSRIPSIKKISVNKLAKKYYRAISETFSVPFRNFYLLGGAGIGKSTTCQVLAFMLGLPYSDTTCFAEMEMSDILGGVYPINGDEDVKREMSEEMYKSIYDELGVSLNMLRDKASFELAYEILTGEYKTNVTEDEIFSIFIQKVSEKVAERLPKKEAEGIIYKYVPSELVKSISSDGVGGLHEIKEPTVIRNEGVLVGLNSLLAEGTLTLPNGEVVKRNPNSVIFLTSNADYAGTTALNESVISRMHLVDNLDFLTAEEMVERAKNIFGSRLDDNYYVAMAEVVKNVEHWIESDEDNMGIASFREYQNWIEYTLKIAETESPTRKELIESAESTIKFKASQIKDNLDDSFDSLNYKPLDMF